ncbi:hypothetical protein MLD38_025953 [Melastoma candidum]|uniref:Uncharacterized protein n=1 Tax=Melastoma candidum TaxID=119954 RepID=A0ACB9NX19_9MYRT|nr:hypothetical protein MLD38_025953 [Melastoma candidum]
MALAETGKEPSFPRPQDDGEEGLCFGKCPGCKIEKLKDENTGIPYKLLFYVFVVVLSAALPISSLFPFLYYMIEDFGISEVDIGLYAGFVGATFMLGRALTSVGWGAIADRIGRKPVAIMGAIAVIVFNTIFGLSVNYWMAVSTRFLTGSLCGILGPMRAYASEICRKEYQALAMSVISTSWGIGLVLGPAIGGYLAQPAEKYPSLFSEDSIFGRFPYFLPCLVISLYTVVALIVCFLLPETLHIHGKNGVESLSPADVVDGVEEGNRERLLGEAEQTDSWRALFKNRPLITSINTYCVFQLHDMAYTEVFSLWTISPRSYGGLSYTTAQVGSALAVSGAGLLIFQLTLYPPLERLVGPIMISRYGAVLAILLLSTFPFIPKLHGTLLTVVVDSASLVKNVLATSITTGLLVLQNQSVKQEQRGVANGLSLTSMSVFKAVGPATAGIIFSWAQNRQTASFLPGDDIVFFILCCIEALGFVLTFRPFLIPPPGY